MSRLDCVSFNIRMAILASERSTCVRKKVGAVLEIDKSDSVYFGYNGSMPDGDHCDEVGCLLTPSGRCIRTIHAEVNAIIKAGNKCKGATLYTTCFPCWECYKLIRRVGVGMLYYLEPYHGEEMVRVLEDIQTRRGSVIKDTFYVAQIAAKNEKEYESKYHSLDYLITKAKESIPKV